MTQQSSFKLQQDDFYAVGSAIAALNLPMVVVQEGGYLLASLGENCIAFLQGLGATENGRLPETANQ